MLIALSDNRSCRVLSVPLEYMYNVHEQPCTYMYMYMYTKLYYTYRNTIGIQIPVIVPIYTCTY